MKRKLTALGLVALAATMVPTAAQAHATPQATMCNSTLAMWMGSDAQGPTVNVSGSIQLSCNGPWTSPYLVIDRISPSGAISYGVATGMGVATYQCNGSASNNYRMDGEIPTGAIYTTGIVNCG